MTIALAALGMVSWVWWIDGPANAARVSGVEKAVESIQANQLEARLDQAYGALCMSPGDPALLERIRELQQQYTDVTGARYPQPSCELLLKLK